MAKIHVGIKALKAAHVHLKESSNAVKDASSNLLLYYAAECGLKYVYLSANNWRSTEKLGKLDHDLDFFVKELRIPATFRAPSFRLRAQSVSHGHANAHQSVAVRSPNRIP